MSKDEYIELYKSQCGTDHAFPAVLSFPDDGVVAIGDVHGDMDLAIDFLTAAQVVSTSKSNGDVYVPLRNVWLNWIGGTTHVVQVGDQVDGCRPMDPWKCKEMTIANDEDADEDIMKLFRDLDIAARKSKGRVISLLGNHELMNIIGNMGYVSKAGIAAYGDEKARIDGFQEIVKDLACTRPSMVVIEPFIFVHGGLHERLAHEYCVYNINSLVRKWLINKVKYVQKQRVVGEGRKKLHGGNGDLDEDEMREVINLVEGAEFSPFWIRDQGGTTVDCKSVDEILEVLKEKNGFELQGMVIGHTPQFNRGINGVCSNKVFRVDIGASKAFDEWEQFTTSSMDETSTDRLTESRKVQVLHIAKNGKNDFTFTVLTKE